MSNALTAYGPAMPLAEVQKLADAVARSGLFGIKTAEQALALMAICQAEGLHPAKAAQEYHVIQGRAALKADAMLARFQRAGGRVRWAETTDQACAGEFTHEQGGTVTIRWTLDDAKRAGLAGKDNWKSYPRQMLRARVISEGVRACFPGAIQGFYTPEEVMDFAPAGEVKAAELVVDQNKENAERVAAGLDPVHNMEQKARATELWKLCKRYDPELATTIKRECGTDAGRMIKLYTEALEKRVADGLRAISERDGDWAREIESAATSKDDLATRVADAIDEIKDRNAQANAEKE